VAQADSPRPDVNAVFGVTGNHGFGFFTPDRVKDNQPHDIYVYAINNDNTGNPPIAGSPIRVTCAPVVQNQPPAVNAGPDRTLDLRMSGSLTLQGSVSDDGLPNPPGTLTVAWANVSGPTSPTYSNFHSPTSTISFNQPGTYVIKLTASDGAVTVEDQMTIQ